MDCKGIQELLIDYIDGVIDNMNEKVVKEHLDNCSNCRKEYEEIKLTIDYIGKIVNNIDTEKEIKLNLNINKKKSIVKIGRFGAIAIAMSLVLIATAFATDIFGFKGWKELSGNQLSEWEKLIENDVGQKLDISVIDNDIKITAEGIIADELNTIIVLKIEDLKGNNRLTPDWDFTPESRAIFLSGEILELKGMPEDIPTISNYDTLYSEEDNTTRLMIRAHPINQDEGDIGIHINRLVGILGLYNKTELEVEGDWNLTIPVKFVESESFIVNESIELDGSRLNIRKVTFAPTITNIEYELELYNKEKDYFMDDITFLIKSGRKTYEGSSLGNRFTTSYFSSESLVSNYSIQSLFLENPKKIDLIISSYETIKKDLMSYDIDWDNLPQEVKYGESLITIEDIEYTDDSTRVVIKEDKSKDREYTNTEFSFRIEEDVIHGNPTDWEIRDYKGRVVDKFVEIWEDKYYSYVFKQELILSEEYFQWLDMNPDNYKDNLNPGKLYIEGQRYKIFPNRKVKLKLK